MFDSIKEEVLSIEKFVFRLIQYFLLATILLMIGLILGVIGFQKIGHLSALENSLSLLGSIDLPNELKTESGQIFTAVYGLFVETVFFLSMAILLAPVVHRIFHRLHIETK